MRQLIGLDEVKWTVSGAAPIAPEVLQFFTDLGIPICELWGMSELSCCATINPPDDIRIGTVGPALPGTELSLAEDGELLVRGPLLMRGYRGQPDKTSETIDADGWLHTGDIATIDDDGYVTIIDRKKELIINSAGKNMSPANIEQVLKASHPLIGQAVRHRRPTSLQRGAARARPRRVRGLRREGRAGGRVDRSAGDRPGRRGADRPGRRGRERPAVTGRAGQALPDPATDWVPGGDELTPTMKLRRRPIGEKYAEQIEELYAD